MAIVLEPVKFGDNALMYHSCNRNVIPCAACEIQELRKFKDALIDALVVDGIYQEVDEKDPRSAINRLISWNQSLALDWRISTHFSLDHQQAKNLYDFFIRCGYISYETDMPIHELFKELKQFVERE
jgi:hypothetical protein